MNDSPQASRPTVAIVSTWFPSQTAPMAGIFVQRDALALREVAAVRVIHLAAPQIVAAQPSDLVDGMPITRIALDLKNPLSIVAAGRELKKQLVGVKVLHSHAMSSLIPLTFAGVHIPWVHTEHWSGYLHWNHGWRKFVRKAMARLAIKPDVLVAVSSYLAKAIERASGRSAEVIGNIVQMPAAQPRPAYEGGRPLRIACVGNLIPVKRPLLAAQACALLNRQGVPTHLSWAGDGPLAEDLARSCQELGVDLTLCGVLDKEDVATLYARSDLVLLPTQGETFSVVAAEALVSGRPVVIGAVGGQSEFVAPPAGRLVEGDAPRAYAEAIIEVLELSAGLSAEEIAAPYRERFSASRLARSYGQIYSRLCRTQAF